MRNESEFLIICGHTPETLAILLDANLNRIAEYNAGSDEVRQLLEGAKALGVLSDNDWEQVFPDFDAHMRGHAVAYRLSE